MESYVLDASLLCIVALILEVTAVHLAKIEDDKYLFATIGISWLMYNVHFIYRAWIARATERYLRSRGLGNDESTMGPLSMLIRSDDKREAASSKTKKIENPMESMGDG